MRPSHGLPRDVALDEGIESEEADEQGMGDS